MKQKSEKDVALQLKENEIWDATKILHRETMHKLSTIRKQFDEKEIVLKQEIHALRSRVNDKKEECNVLRSSYTNKYFLHIFVHIR